MLYAIIGVLFLLADQFIKYWTVTHIELNTGIYPLLPGILHMTNIRNFGAAFGLFSDQSWLRWALLGLLAAFTLFIVLGLIFRYLRTGFARWTGVLLLAGLLGNGIDRAIYGYVVDMFELEVINFAIFNLADVLAVFFGVLFCIAVITGGLGAPEKEEEEEEPRPVRRQRPEGEQPRRQRPEGEPQRRKLSPEEIEERRKARAAAEGQQRRQLTPEEIEARERARKARAAAKAAAAKAEAEKAESPAEAVRAARTVSRPQDAAVQTARRPAAPKASAPAAKPAPKAGGDEFDLDSIMAEFK